MGKLRRFFFIILFVASTLFGALHELSPVHGSDGDCPVCMVETHSVALCTHTTTPPAPVLAGDTPAAGTDRIIRFEYSYACGSRDPPSPV